MLEEVGLVQRTQVSAVPLHVEYSLTLMGRQLEEVIRAVLVWSNTWLSDRCEPAATIVGVPGAAPGRISGRRHEQAQ
jgi:DNA-binding HxlR family transcriptional regulator